jgi:Epoxide hydrolase N terminus
MSSETEIRPFRVDMPEEAIADLRRRIGATRWPSRELVTDRSQGVQLATVQELARYWAAEYDWRACEAQLNALTQCTTVIDGQEIHFIHARSPHPGALPLIITHGWPGSVIEMLGVIGPLTDPAAHGGDAGDAFDLVVRRTHTGGDGHRRDRRPGGCPAGRTRTRTSRRAQGRDHRRVPFPRRALRPGRSADNAGDLSERSPRRSRGIVLAERDHH